MGLFEETCLHKINKDTFGLNHDNYIGSIQQINKSKDNWIDFYVENRILYLIEKQLTRDYGLPLSKKIESVSKK